MTDLNPAPTGKSLIVTIHIMYIIMIIKLDLLAHEPSAQPSDVTLPPTDGALDAHSLALV